LRRTTNVEPGDWSIVRESYVDRVEPHRRPGGSRTLVQYESDTVALRLRRDNAVTPELPAYGSSTPGNAARAVECIDAGLSVWVSPVGS
jgi:hypothetical protein